MVDVLFKTEAPHLPGEASIVVLCSVPADFDAEALGAALVEQSLAACVQIGPDVTSIYRWQGSIEKSRERVISIKTRPELFERLEAVIQGAHPYEVPEIIALPVSAGHVPYLAWIAETTANGPSSGRERPGLTSPTRDSRAE